MKSAAHVLAFLVFLVLVVGCEPPSGSTGVTTNTVVRTVVVTNVVTLTNTVIQPKPVASVSHTRRKTAVYRVSSGILRPSQLRAFLMTAGARVLTCDLGSVALVEAPDAVVAAMRRNGVVQTDVLMPSDKIANLAISPHEKSSPFSVRILPLSSIDLVAVSKAIRDLRGEIVATETQGVPRIRAQLNFEQIRKLAERVDVRLIEREVK